MTRELDVINKIMTEKEQEIKNKGQLPLDDEGKALAEHKRFTFDVVDTPSDPLR